MDMPAS